MTSGAGAVASEFVEPAYGTRSLGDVVPAVAQALGAPLADSATRMVLPEAPAYVVFLIDGLGAGCCGATPTPRRSWPPCSRSSPPAPPECPRRRPPA